MKLCTICDTSYDERAYHKTVNSKDGLAAHCKGCRAKMSFGTKVSYDSAIELALSDGKSKICHDCKKKKSLDEIGVHKVICKNCIESNQSLICENCHSPFEPNNSKLTCDPCHEKKIFIKNYGSDNWDIRQTNFKKCLQCHVKRERKDFENDNYSCKKCESPLLISSCSGSVEIALKIGSRLKVIRRNCKVGLKALKKSMLKEIPRMGENLGMDQPEYEIILIIEKDSNFKKEIDAIPRILFDDSFGSQYYGAIKILEKWKDKNILNLV